MVCCEQNKVRLTTLDKYVIEHHRTGLQAPQENAVEIVVVVVFIFQYGNIHLHTSGSIFINKYIFEKKTIWKSEIAYQNKS